MSKRIASSSGIQEHSRPSLLLNLFSQGLSVSTGPCEDRALHPSAEFSAVRASAEAELEKNQEDHRLSGEMGTGPQTKPWEIPPTTEKPVTHKDLTGNGLDVVIPRIMDSQVMKRINSRNSVFRNFVNGGQSIFLQN